MSFKSLPVSPPERPKPSIHVCGSLPLTDTHLSAETVLYPGELPRSINSTTHSFSCHGEGLLCFSCALFRLPLLSISASPPNLLKMSHSEKGLTVSLFCLSQGGCVLCSSAILSLLFSKHHIRLSFNMTTCREFQLVYNTGWDVCPNYAS